MIFVTERPIVRCIIARYTTDGELQTRVVEAESVPRYLRDRWLNCCRDPFDLDLLRKWEMDERESRFD